MAELTQEQADQLETLAVRGPTIVEAYDASTAQAHQYFDEVKQWVDNSGASFESINKAAMQLGENALALKTMLKFSASEHVIASLEEPVLITLINPVYKERGRMSRREDHPHGENSLRMKLETFKHFNSLNSNFRGRVFVIDDECPEKSGEMAEEILADYNNDDNRVFFLGQAIAEHDPDLPAGITVKSGVNRSVKGGSVLFGMRKALATQSDVRHIIIDNDADLSIHPMQIGLIIKDIVDGKMDAVAGSRREVDSVALIGEGRNQRGALFIDIWQSLLPQLAARITDTNRAYKAFESNALRQILSKVKIYTFPYQIELLQACISNELRLRKKGIAYIDSEAASTQSGENITETYLNQIHQIIDIAMRYETVPADHPLVRFFLSISE
ncbi:MAG: hypothetical protein GY732_14860, partial [Gammaproteobacteria bacterium]|nr:hypothetical protein [Gammaproteobacteria bacterium]